MSVTERTPLESVLYETAQHQLQVLHDDGVYRHLRFARPDSSLYWFNLVTWPGRLAITGDVGDYVFARIEDMFEFLRRGIRLDGGLTINESYWAEKCEAECKRSGLERYSPDKFRAAVELHLHGCFGEEVSDELRVAVEEEVLCDADDGEDAARRAVDLFEHDGFEFVDFHEADLKDYTHHFRWCLYAIVWGIQQYDKHRAAAVAATTQEKVP